MPSFYSTEQNSVASDPIGNADITNGWAPLWSHTQPKIVWDGTLWYTIQAVNSGGSIHSFQLYSIDNRQEPEVITPLTFRIGSVYQGACILLDSSNRLHIFYIETNTTDAQAGTTRTIRHYRSNGAANTLTNTAITAGEWTLINSWTHSSVMHGYMSVAYDRPNDTLFLAYNDNNANLLLARNLNQAGWSTAITVQASSASHQGGELYRALYTHIVPMGANAVDLLWIRSYNQSNYDQVIYRRVTSISASTMDAAITLLDRSPGGPADPLLVSNPYMFNGMDGYVHAMYWRGDTNQHFHTRRTGSDAFSTAVNITSYDPNARSYRQYGVFTEQLNPVRLHAYIAPSSAAVPPDNGLAHFWSNDHGTTWNFEQDYAPIRASTSLDDYPDAIHTFSNRSGSADNRNHNIYLYHGLSTVVNSLSANALRVVYGSVSYEVTEDDYIADIDIHSILETLIADQWRSQYDRVPLPRIIEVDEEDIERIEMELDAETVTSNAGSDIIALRAGGGYEETQVGYLFLFRTIRIPVEILIYTKNGRQRLLNLRREIARIIYANQINFAAIGFFHRLRYQRFRQEYDANKKIFVGSIDVEFSADGIPIAPQSALENT